MNEIRLYKSEQIEHGKTYFPNIIQINAQEKWGKGITGKEIIISVIDTGVDEGHPNLKNQIIGGFNFSEEHLGDISRYEDGNGHGTHIAGIIAGKSRVENDVVGIAPDAKILALKVLNNKGVGSVESLIDAINYSIDWCGPKQEKVNIINLSLGVKSDNPLLLEAIQNAVRAQIPVVAAAGNYGDGDNFTREFLYPGIYQEVIEVGAVNRWNKIAFFTNTNEEIDIYAPGVAIKSTYINNQITPLSGTSMAAPHVSGALALLMEQERNNGNYFNEKDIFSILCNSTKPLKLDNINIAGCGTLYLD